MKKKTVLLILCAVMLLGALTACGGASVKDNVACADLATAVESGAGGSIDMIDAPDSYIAGTMKMSSSDYADKVVKINSRGINVDEYGIFKGADKKQTESIKAALEAYIQLRKDIWIADYMPEEYPKLDNSEIKVVGNYVMYTILSNEARDTAVKSFEDALKN